MTHNNILYETIPVARMGVRKNSDKVKFSNEVVVATDYSCFAYMLEEYISYGVTSNVLPGSAPEIPFVKQLPELLTKRLKILDDQNEIEAVARILFGLRREFNIELDEENNSLSFPKDVSPTIRNRISQIHLDVKRLALGFNHGLNVELNTVNSANNFRQLRKITKDTKTRVIMSQFEGILSRYETGSFGSIISKDNSPRDLISIFDRFLNDPDYITFSQLVSKLNEAETRESALLEVRELARRLSSSRFVVATWDYITKILKVWPGIPLPESKDLAGIISGRTIPATVDLTEPRSRALENWLSYAKQNPPLGRDGRQLEGVQWLPPLSSMRVEGPGSFFTLGTVGELLQALEAEVKLSAASDPSDSRQSVNSE